MKRLHQRVNLVPVVAKSDTMTAEELAAFKNRITEELHFHGIQVFKPQTSEYDDAETIEEIQHMLSRMPFAVVGSTSEIDIGNGKKIRGRKYPWGVIEGWFHVASRCLVDLSSSGFSTLVWVLYLPCLTTIFRIINSRQ